MISGSQENQNQLSPDSTEPHSASLSIIEPHQNASIKGPLSALTGLLGIYEFQSFLLEHGNTEFSSGGKEPLPCRDGAATGRGYPA